MVPWVVMSYHLSDLHTYTCAFMVAEFGALLSHLQLEKMNILATSMLVGLPNAIMVATPKTRLLSVERYFAGFEQLFAMPNLEFVAHLTCMIWAW